MALEGIWVHEGLTLSVTEESTGVVLPSYSVIAATRRSPFATVGVPPVLNELAVFENPEMYWTNVGGGSVGPKGCPDPPLGG